MRNIEEFIKKFKINYEKKEFESCPNLKVPEKYRYDRENSKYIGYFNKNICDKCRYRKKCPKTEDKDNRYKISIGNIEKKVPMGMEIYKGYDVEICESNTELIYVEILNKGVNFRRQGKFELAKETYLKAIKMEPKRSVGYFNLGKVLYILKDYEASIRAYKVAYELGELNSVLINLLEHLGHALLDPKNKNGKYKKAIHDYSNGLRSIYNFKATAELDILVTYKQICIKEGRSYLEKERD
ncbi:MAG: tetratricopeptide repeat protein [Clostridium sp.]